MVINDTLNHKRLQLMSFATKTTITYTQSQTVHFFDRTFLKTFSLLMFVVFYPLIDKRISRRIFCSFFSLYIYFNFFLIYYRYRYIYTFRIGRRKSLELVRSHSRSSFVIFTISLLILMKWC